MALAQTKPANPVLLVFGPQALTFNAIAFKDLASSLRASPDHQWVLAAIDSLADTWKLFANHVESLRSRNDDSLLQALGRWLKDGQAPVSTFPLPNVLLSPLVVASQLTQFAALVRAALPDLGHEEIFPISFTSNAETLGLCTGGLSALAVSAASTLADLERYGTVAIKLSMLTGSVVDMENQSADAASPALSFSAAWTSQEVRSAMLDVLAAYPEAYESVDVDEKRTTITATSSTAQGLIQRLKVAGIFVTEVALQGRYHWPSHKTMMEQLVAFCEYNESLRLPDAAHTIIRNRLNSGGAYSSVGNLSEIAVRDILVQRSKWYDSFKFSLTSRSVNAPMLVTCFGPERCVPPSLIRELGSRLVYTSDIDMSDPKGAGRALGLIMPDDLTELPDDRIAVIGAACHIPGADDMEGFWEVLVKGESQHREAPVDRFKLSTVWRDAEPGRKWFGNFVDHYDTFDHKFFKKSPREMSSTDPQHRLALQVAYQAVQQSGYYAAPSPDKHISCYMGVGNVDYEDNVACYPATAYTATGNLKSFLAGKISHYFGWTGPSLTIDTACSSSSVAIHHACRSILNGEASAALAGGANLITSPDWYHNLAGASFLSPSGQCKPFDANADGYCRGEGVAAVLLKKLSAAIADGDQVFGVIAGSKVYQNQNCTAITVPNSPSLSQLFDDVVKQSRLEPRQISVVEAHGTGTTAGDPAEFDGIREVFGGPTRSDRVQLSSVKGLVGHTECASGAVSLLKILLMINKQAIPPQASFRSINPTLRCKQEDNIDIPTKLKTWDTKFRAALINNYGASGSNASLVVTESPQLAQAKAASEGVSGVKYPFWLAANDELGLKAYIAKLQQFLQLSGPADAKLTISNLSFQVARQTNRTLSQSLILGADSISNLTEQLTAYERGVISSSVVSDPRPVILCFGGQISTHVGLDQDVFNNVSILRAHLEQCNTTSLSLGYGSIFPEIFSKSPIEDIPKLQLILFSMQYACAKSWISCGVKVAAVIGHSFGELTALCISGSMSLEDTMKMIAGRATIIQNNWGSETGSMIAVEASLADVESLLSRVNGDFATETPASIACFNGPTSFTLAGPSKLVESVADIIRDDASLIKMKAKKLSVTHAFHSQLVDSLTKDLEQLGHTVRFRDPTIKLERATESKPLHKQDSHYVFDHMRKPVYFVNAVRRLTSEFPNAIWLEAGSNSTVTNLASRAVAASNASHFQPVNLTTDGAIQSLADATLKLWKAGLDVSFWTHHSNQTAEYTPVFLPPYQFEKSRHWMDLRQDVPAAERAEPEPTVDAMQTGFSTFVGYLDDARTSARFQINTTFDKVRRLVDGHIMAGAAGVWPGTFQLDVAIDALMTLSPEFLNGDYQPQMEGMKHYHPLVVRNSTSVWLETYADDSGLIWDWKLFSTNGSNTIHHTSATIVFAARDDKQRQSEFQQLERLSGRSRCVQLLDDPDIADVLRGRNIYRAFSEVIDYKEIYRHITKIVGRDHESASRVVKSHWTDTWLDTALADCFGQTAGIFVNLMTDEADIAERGMFICDGIMRWLRSPQIASYESLPSKWDVYAIHHRLANDRYISDVFAFDALSGSLIEVALGIGYQRVSVPGIRKILGQPQSGTESRVSGTPPVTTGRAPAVPSHNSRLVTSNGSSAHVSHVAAKKHKPAKAAPGRKGPDVPHKTRLILDALCGVPPDQVKDDSDLVDMGLDSLMSMELVREVSKAFNITLENSQLADLTDFQSLVTCIRQTLGVDGDGTVEPEDEGNQDDDGTSHTNGIGAANGIPNGTSNGHTHAVSSINGNATSVSDAGLDSSLVLDAFQVAKDATDDFIINGQLGTYCKEIMPRSTKLCVAHICNAFEQLGCPIRSAAAGDKLERITYLPRHEKFMRLIYDLLENDARLIEINGSMITRTAVSCPSEPTETMLQALLRDEPIHAAEHKLTEMIGKKFADCLTGKEDGLQMIFGSPEGREIVTDVYAKSPVNAIWIQQAEFFLENLAQRLPRNGEPLRILEMGAGTGGTTVKLLPMLARIGIPVEYTMTDLSSSLVAAGRKRFRQYPFMKFKVLNIETDPDPQMLHSQDIILATNCVHATRNLTISTTNIHKMLRPSGFLLLLEMTEQVPWVDFIFGLVEGWWLFEDGRNHALQPATYWDKILRSVGYGHVDWTEGHRPEANIQHLIIALASRPRYDRMPSIPHSPVQTLTDVAGRQAEIDSYVVEHCKAFPSDPARMPREVSTAAGKHVLITGATGSLGCHVVAHQARRAEVDRVICLNRLSQIEARSRQLEALETKGISLDSKSLAKLHVIQTDTSKSFLGLSEEFYKQLCYSVSHVVHNAWPMSIKRPLKGYETQFRVMRNLIDLALEAAILRPKPFRVSFQFISSIGVMGYHPIWKRTALAPECRTSAHSVLPVGYADAKLVCEHMLDETLHRFPELFRPHAVRIAQIAGSTAHPNFWNSTEHLVLLFKSSQTLGALPDLGGNLSWCPVDHVAGTLGDLMAGDHTPYSIYHIENPHRQSYKKMIRLFAAELRLPSSGIIPFSEWIHRVDRHPGTIDENPAKQLVPFFSEHFIRMSCGDLVLDTRQSLEHSSTLRKVGPVSDELVVKYINAWKLAGILN